MNSIFESQFNTWARASSHNDLLCDKVRNLAYQQAISLYAKREMTVLDIGCGTGILSFFAARAGCKKVTAVDHTPIIQYARKAARENGLDKKIRFLQEDIFDLSLSEKVDVIVHEQIGSFLWNEDIIRKIKFAREKFLEPGGRILPGYIDLFLVPVNLDKFLFESWRKPKHGLAFKSFEEPARREFFANCRPHLLQLNRNDLFLCEPKLVNRVDLYNDTRLPEVIETEFRITKTHSAWTGVLGFFEISFEDRIRLSCRPGSPNTHWRSFLLPVAKLKLGKHDQLKFKLRPQIDPHKWKWEAWV